MNFWNPSVECLSRDELIAHEDAALDVQLRYIFAHSAFYKQKFKGIDWHVAGREALGALPFTEKDELRASQEEFPPFGNYLATSSAQIIRVHKTSGTTGRPLYLAMTQRDIEATHECGARAFFAAGLRPDDRVVHCLNYQLWAGGVTDHLSLERVGAMVIPFGVGNTHTLLRTIRDLQVNCISSTPSYLVHLAGIVREQLDLEPHALGLRKGFFGGEPGLQNPRVRAKIETTWNLRAMDANYGMADVLSIFGAECDVREGLHFHGQGMLLVELIDPATLGAVEIRTGAWGELVYTNLTREAQPLVRYRSHDVAEIISTAPCVCGRTSFRFRVLGRSDEMVHVRGVNVFPSAIADLLGGFANELSGEFQIVLDTPPPYDLLPIRAELAASAPPEALPALSERIASALHERLNFRAAIELVPPQTLPRTEGKTRRVVRTFQ
jgi:phenylacetate-CoA ligase